VGASAGDDRRGPPPPVQVGPVHGHLRRLLRLRGRGHVDPAAGGRHPGRPRPEPWFDGPGAGRLAGRLHSQRTRGWAPHRPAGNPLRDPPGWTRGGSQWSGPGGRRWLRHLLAGHSPIRGGRSARIGRCPQGRGPVVRRGEGAPSGHRHLQHDAGDRRNGDPRVVQLGADALDRLLAGHRCHRDRADGRGPRRLAGRVGSRTRAACGRDLQGGARWASGVGACWSVPSSGWCSSWASV
jgi:hypothetical protein